MSDHKPECVLSDPCSADEPRHGFCGNSDLSWCMHCEQQCICDRIKRAEDRVRSEHDEYGAMLGGIEFGAERSWDYALDAAREAVLKAQDVAKSGEGVVVNITLGAGRGHVYVNRDAVLAAIDALREKP